MKKFLVGILYIVIFVLIQGCAQQASIIPTDIPRTSIVEHPIPSSSSIPATELSTTTPSYTKEAHFKTNCLNVNQSLLSGQLSSGAIIFGNREVVNGRYAPGIILLDLTSQSKTQIDNIGEHFLDIKESPDRTRIVYQLVKDGASPDSLIVATSDLHQEKIIAWKDEWEIILGWTDNSHIIFRKNDNTITLENPREKPPELIIFDINTLKEEIVKPDFPDIYDFPEIPYWDGFSAATYDPAFTRAVYMRWTDQTQSTYSYALWDMKNRQALTIQTVVGYPTPKWSPDGSQFVTTGLIDLDPRELFSISRDGQIKRLTYLSNYSPDMEIVDYAWSPNSQRIALLLVKQYGDKIATLAILDIDTGIVTDYCVSITINGDTYTNTFTPIWSPNSQQVIVQDWYTADHRRIILIDVKDNYAVQIAEDLEPLAWVKYP